MFLNIVDAVLKIVGKYPNVARDVSTSSMTQYTKNTRTEPITMIDSSLSTMAEMPDLMATLTSIYAAMYSQSFSIAINSEIGDIKVMRTLEKINPNRSKMDGLTSLTASFASRDLVLPDYTNPYNNVEPTVSIEKLDINVPKSNRGLPGLLANKANTTTTVEEYDENGNVTNRKKVEVKDPGSSSKVDLDPISSFMSNLTTGILFDVTVEGDGRKVSIPISVRLLANKMNSDMIISLFTAAVRNQTSKERYREWRSGGISFWNDVILCRDMLREYRKNLIRDSSGMFNEVLRRKNNNTAAGLLSLNPSISQISNLVILSKETADAFERATSKKLSNESHRDLIFKNTQMLIVAVVNRSRETVTLYYHDISIPTTVTFKELKGASGGSGAPDVMEILKAYQMGNGINL